MGDGAGGPRGVLLVDKPAGISSHSAVAQVRRALSVRRVGHAGTLDPDASGLLVVGVGPGTRLLHFLVGLDKSYSATIRLGMATESDDSAGSVISAMGCSVPVDLEPHVALFRGPIRQRPSAVSAVKVAGRRAYQRVRSGEDVVLPERDVTIQRFDVLGTRTSVVGGVPVVDVDVALDVSSGTYVRAVARDLGAELGVGGHLTRLRRTSVGPFHVEDAVAPADVTPAALLPLGQVAGAVLPVVSVAGEDARLVANGVRVPSAGDVPAGPVALLDPDGALLAVATAGEGRWQHTFVVA